MHEKLRALRLRARLTQHRLAQRSGVSKRTISNIERGATVPALPTQAALLRALGIPFSNRADVFVQPPGRRPQTYRTECSYCGAVSEKQVLGGGRARHCDHRCAALHTHARRGGRLAA